jgi:hypothetical protein
MDTKSITITDETILSYYRENPHVDIIAMNIMLIDILKSLSTNLSATINSTVTSKILSIVSDIDKNISSFRSDIISTFNEKLNQTRKEYVEDLKTQLTNNILSNNEKLSSLIDRNADTILARTTSILNDIVPKSQDKNYLQIENCIKTFCSSIEQDTKKLLETKHKDENSSKIIIDNIESNFSKMVSSIQAPIFQLVQSNEERTIGGIQKVKDEISQQNLIQEKINAELNDFLNKYKHNSSLKGGVSESELYFMLQSIMPSDEIIRVSSETASCDFKVNRKNKDKPTILFENKDYAATVNTEEVEKFERDIKLQRCHGIFISQNSPIAYKENFHIDIINNLVHLYIPNAGYDVERIKLAINIVDSLSEKLNLVVIDPNEEIYELSMDDFDNLKKEYCDFANRKLELMDLIKMMTKQLCDKLDAIEMPVLKRLTVGNTETKNLGIICSLCNKFNAKNKASLGAHMKHCRLVNGGGSATISIKTK